jgi:hypothetical protein
VILQKIYDGVDLRSNHPLRFPASSDSGLIPAQSGFSEPSGTSETADSGFAPGFKLDLEALKP